MYVGFHSGNAVITLLFMLQLSVIEKKLFELKEVRGVLELAKTGMTFESCVALALRRFYTLYRDFIVSLVCLAGFRIDVFLHIGCVLNCVGLYLLLRYSRNRFFDAHGYLVVMPCRDTSIHSYVLHVLFSSCLCAGHEYDAHTCCLHSCVDSPRRPQHSRQTQ